MLGWNASGAARRGRLIAATNGVAAEARLWLLDEWVESASRDIDPNQITIAPGGRDDGRSSALDPGSGCADQGSSVPPA
jgi:hypothetical protein